MRLAREELKGAPLDLARRNARRVLAGVSTVAFATSLFSRAVDPIVPAIAADLGVTPERVALLSTAFALPFAPSSRSSGR